MYFGQFSRELIWKLLGQCMYLASVRDYFAALLCLCSVFVLLSYILHHFVGPIVFCCKHVHVICV